MSKLNKILLVSVVVLVVVLGVVVVWQKTGGFEKSYYAVYLDTGDLYFGKLSVFPRLSLSNVYLMQKTNDAKNPLTFAKFTDVFWGPEDRIYLNKDKVVWKVKLNSTGQVVDYFKNPSSFKSQSQPTTTQPSAPASNRGK